MGYYKSIYTQVEEMYYDGAAPIEIAEWTGLHFDEVVAILEEIGEIA
jgi:hypothetical protein